jgi:hypothetical protein
MAFVDIVSKIDNLSWNEMLNLSIITDIEDIPFSTIFYKKIYEQVHDTISSDVLDMFKMCLEEFPPIVSIEHLSLISMWTATFLHINLCIAYQNDDNVQFMLIPVDPDSKSNADVFLIYDNICHMFYKINKTLII